MFCVVKDNKALCTACTACIHICPQNCIRMEVDKNGFLYPVINETECINCNLCFKICPENIHEKLKRKHLPSICYAAKHLDEKILIESSSGGAFTAIIQALNNYKWIFGACYDKNMKVIHKGTMGKTGYKKFLKSKYVQSDLQDSYKEIKILLKNDEKVIFSGTPCQIAGLKSYLGNLYNGLFCIELLCYGVASPGVFYDYIKYLENNFKSKVNSFIFRDKHPKKGMWRDFLTTIKLQNGKKISSRHDLYTLGFLANIFTRESCLLCRYACAERIGDIVIGDFWGIEKYKSDLYSDMGVSLLIPITDKGNRLIDIIPRYMQIEEVPIQYAIEGNSILLNPTKNNPLRKKFFKLYKKYPINKAISVCIRPRPLLQRIIFKVLNVLNEILKRNNINR